MLWESDVCTLAFDATTLNGDHVNTIHFCSPTEILTADISKLPGGKGEDYARHIIDLLDDMSIIWSKKHPKKDENEENRKSKVKGHLLGHIKSTLSDRVSSNHKAVESLERQLDISLLELNCQVHPLDSVSSVCREALLDLQKTATSIKSSARDDCRAAIVVYNISKLRYKGNGDPAGFKLCCLENKWPMTLFPRYVGNRFHVLFHSSALIFVHRVPLLAYLKTKSTSAVWLRKSLRDDLLNEDVLVHLQALGKKQLNKN